jgi:chaperone modulatory protein CbpM
MISKRVNVTIRGVILDENTEVTLDDLCRACRVDQAAIVALVEEGIVEPRAMDTMPWRFSGTTLPQVARALRLQRDLELNPAGVAFALDLLSEIEDLRKRLKIMDINEGHRYD